MENRIILEVDNNVTYIKGRLNSEEYNGLKKVLGFYPEDAFWMKKKQKNSKSNSWRDKWDGLISTICWNEKFCHCNVKKKGMHFPTGLLFKTVSYFRENNISFIRKDIRNKTDINYNKYSLSKNFEKRKYQEEIINKIVEKKTDSDGNIVYKAIDRGMLKLPTGSGKSAVACDIIRSLGVSPTIFYVPSIDLLKQTKDEISRFILEDGKNVEVGMIGGGCKEIKNINVMTIQTAVKALGGVWIKFDEEDSNEDDTDISDIKDQVKDLIKNAKLMIGDECVEGHTLIETEKGKVQIRDAKYLGCKQVLSYDIEKKEKVWKNILNFWERGKRETRRIVLKSGKEIICTPEHLIMTYHLIMLKPGWLEAKGLSHNCFVFSSDERMEEIDYNENSGDNLVYDIEVEDTHCFFANDILVHNCQHWSAETCQIISDNSEMAQYRFLLSATPFRDKGDDILIEACAGKTIVDISASYLIKEGYLIRPTIYFSKINNMKNCGLSSYQEIYKKAVIENEYRNKQIVELSTRFRDNGRKVLILIKNISHGKMLEKLIPDSIFVYGDTSKKKREKYLDIIREGKPSITIASIIFDEGINVPALDTLINGGSGKSTTRALQRVGRIIRPYPGKNDAIVVDFMDCCKYLLNHSKKRAKIYKSESEFKIIGDGF